MVIVAWVGGSHWLTTLILRYKSKGAYCSLHLAHMDCEDPFAETDWGSSCAEEYTTGTRTRTDRPVCGDHGGSLLLQQSSRAYQQQAIQPLMTCTG